MKCKKCKSLLEEGVDEFSVVHLWETHGVHLSDLRVAYPDLDWNKIAEMKRDQRVTGQAGAEDVFGKKAHREIKITDID